MHFHRPGFRARLATFTRPLLALVALCCGPVQATELNVAVIVYDTAQVSAQGARLPGAASGGDLMAIADELARETCRRINARCHYSYVPFAEILPGVENGRFDLGFGNALRTLERGKRVAFSDPVWRSSSRLIGTPATAQAFAEQLGQPVTVDNLRNARVAVVTGSRQQTYLEQVADERKLTVLAVPTPAETIDLLRDKRADFALLPMRVGYSMLSRDAPARFQFVGPAVAEHGLGDTTHVVMSRDDPALRLAVNRALAEIRADGTYQRIVQRHFPVSLD